MAGKLPTHREPQPADLQAAYDEGLQGWIWDKHVERQWENFWAEQPAFATAAPAIQGAGNAIKRVMLWRSREKYDPGAYGKESQTTGDCTSHGCRNARDTSRAVEIDIHGEAERYYKRGATEPTYGARGHGGQGMDPARAARFVTDYGWLVRKDYGVVDLTKYDSSIGHNWGRGGVPDDVKELCKEFNVGVSTRPRTLDEAKDLLANGYAGHSGQQWGCDAKAGRDGINRKTKSWNHDMATVGYDFSEEIFPEPVFFVPNSWGSWNQRNPKWDEDALGPWIKGMIVVSADDYERFFVKSGSIMFYSAIKGFPVQHLPKYGFDYV